MNKNVADAFRRAQLALNGPRPLSNDEIAAVAGGVVICYGPVYTPGPPSHAGEGAPVVPPGHSAP
jgi:hypothetical protein